MRRLRLLRSSAAVLLLSAAIPLGCWGSPYTPPGNGGGGTGGTGGTSTAPTTSTASTGSTSASGTGGTGGTGPSVKCPVTFSHSPSSPVQNLRVPGEWQGFDESTAPVMTDAGGGVYSVTVDLAPGLWAYKLVHDDATVAGNWFFDPNQGRRKYYQGTENSGIKVPDCSRPTFDVAQSQAARPSQGQGTYQAELTYRDAIDKSGADPAGFSATMEHEGTSTPLSAQQLKVDASGKATISLSGLGDGKYRILVQGKTKSGKVSEATRLIFWIEGETFSWQDALIYMVMIDRYRDGDATNNPAPASGADPRGDFLGGDLQGLKASITDGTLDKLGIRAIWVSPFNTNPKGAYLAADGVHLVTGYHGYWPIKGRETDARWGGDQALKDMIKEAHKHGIRVLQDYVIHHVHEDHEYATAHPEWFKVGCICGTSNCDWTAHAQDCSFTSYLPNIDWTNADAGQAFVDDAVWWLDTFDLDGFRIDAVKHVPEVATRNVTAEVREGFEKAGTRHFLMGETAMGWNDCNDPCNDENYGTIAHYIGPQGLDGQIDFVLYHGVSYNTFAYGDKGMIHADYWANHGLQKWPAGAIMTPYIGSQDTVRFATLADYAGKDRSIPGNQWTNIAVAPTTSEPYRRTRIGMAWLLGLPGAPLLYYGDEYGQWGGADPNNRLMWKSETALSADESATLATVRKLGKARQAVKAMRRGNYTQVYNQDENTLVFGRGVSGGAGALVGLTRQTTAQTITVDASKVGFAAGTKLNDAMGGPAVTVGAAGMTSVTIPAGGSVVLAP
jgi:glycosidase